MKLNASLSKFLTNKMVLNIVTILALFNIIGYFIMGNVNFVLYFIVFAILARFFSKNMTIVLGIPLIVVNLLAVRGNILEGMENNNDKAVNSTKEESNSEKIDQKKIDDLVKDNKNKPDEKSGQGLTMQPLEDIDEKTNNAAQIANGEQEGKAGFEAGRSKNRGHNIDYATTVEDAYDELNNILGSEGIQRLTSDTQNLMKQQMQLAKAMESMGPMMKSLAPMVENLKGMMGDGKEGLGGIMDLAKKLTGPSS
jgi:hypothetical protein